MRIIILHLNPSGCQDPRCSVHYPRLWECLEAGKIIIQVEEAEIVPYLDEDSETLGGMQ